MGLFSMIWPLLNAPRACCDLEMIRIMEVKREWFYLCSILVQLSCHSVIDQMKKIILLSFLFALILACAGSEKSNASNGALDGPTVYKKYCIVCHGADGKLALNGAKDITASELTKEERVELIRNGRNTMTPFGGILSEEEIESVATYTLTLK